MDNCLISSEIYEAHVTKDEDNTGKNYIGLTEERFKQRCTLHKVSFRDKKYANRTKLVKHIWKLKFN